MSFGDPLLDSGVECTPSKHARRHDEPQCKALSRLDGWLDGRLRDVFGRETVSCVGGGARSAVREREIERESDR